MSRRPTPGADRAAQNAQTLKALVKLEGNKVCSDCKRNKHPRWASWNLGVFLCIRCSGIHRGMGTHISRVKSVDLDSWTDEQLQSILKWGNSRANKYWEAKLAPGHVPSEAKIENFIRTKYESKRWAMDGTMPDPSTLDADGDDDVPLTIVQEKAKIERSTSQRLQSASQRQQPQTQTRAAPVNLFDDFQPSPPVRPNTADIPDNKPTKTGPPPAAKPAKPQDSLLGLDFFGPSPTSGGGRPSSASSNPAATTNSRGDLKNSILSLYASAPKPQPTSQPSHDRQPSFGGVASTQPTQQDAFGGLADAFSGLTFPGGNKPRTPSFQSPSSTTSIPGGFPTVFPAKATPSTAQVTSPPPLSGGSFFDNIPSNPPVPKPSNSITRQPSNGLDFFFAQNLPAAPAASPPPVTKQSKTVTSIPTDLFASDDFGGFASTAPGPAPVTAPMQTAASPPAPKPAAAPIPSANNSFNSAFNLSSPKASMTKPQIPPVQPSVVSASNTSMFDPWGSGNDSSPWGAPETSPPKPAAPSIDLGKVPSRLTPNDISGGWGSPITSANKATKSPTVAADEDFGGWTSASTTQAPATAQPKPSGNFGGASDPFDNPWG